MPGKNIPQSKEISFDIFPEHVYEEEISKQVNLKLKITISGMVASAIQKQVLWDTLISTNNLHDFLKRERDETIRTTITADGETLRHLVINYLAIYSYQGTINTRSGSSGHRESEIPFRIGV
jgi:hypothetical protein